MDGSLWAWSFVGGGETDYILFIVTGFIVVVVALQLVLMRVRRVDKTIDESNSAKDGALSFRQWARAEFEADKRPPARRRGGIIDPTADRRGGNRHDGVWHRISDRRACRGDVSIFIGITSPPPAQRRGGPANFKS